MGKGPAYMRVTPGPQTASRFVLLLPLAGVRYPVSALDGHVRKLVEGG